MKIKHKIRVLCLCLACLVLLGGAGYLSTRGDWFYRLSLKFRRYPAPDLTVLTEPVERELALAELLADPRVVLGQDLLLVNAAHPFCAEEAPELTDADGLILQPDALEAYRALKESVLLETGSRLFVRSAYRSAEEQATEQEESQNAAARAGESEHETGLALDVCVSGYGGMSFLKTKAGRFVNEHCADYGLIVRYPDGKRDVTGFGYEPWHLRFVGQPHARIMATAGITLEEYLSLLVPEVVYQSGNHVILRTSGEHFPAPADWISCRVSPDNTGFWIVTFEI